MSESPTKRDDMPALDPGAVIQYSAIRYVAGYPESYVKEYAIQYAEQRVREEREADERLLREAMEAIEYMHREKCDYMVRNKLGDPYRETAAKLAIPAIAALRKRLGE